MSMVRYRMNTPVADGGAFRSSALVDFSSVILCVNVLRSGMKLLWGPS